MIYKIKPIREIVSSSGSCFALCLLIFSGCNKYPGELPHWENTEVIGINTEETTATFYHYLSENMTNDWTQIPNYQSLNGTWKFHWVSKPAERPVNFFKNDFDTRDWKEIDVPSDWQMRGYNYPIYLNIQYPFPKNAPFIPHDFNPVGSYKREFNIDPDWIGQKTYLYFGGVNSAFYVWINGEYVPASSRIACINCRKSCRSSTTSMLIVLDSPVVSAARGTGPIRHQKAASCRTCRWFQPWPASR